MTDVAIHPGFSSDPRLAAHATSTAPAWLWSADATRVLWANAVGAAIFDAATPAALAGRHFDPHHQAASQILRLAASLRPGGAARLERLRGFGTGFRMLVCACSPVPLAERVCRLFDGTDAAIAAFALDGTLLHATPEGRARLGGATTLAGLGAEHLAQDAIATGRAAGELHLGPLTVERLGADAATVLVATFGMAQVALEPPESRPAEPELAPLTEV